MKMTKIMIAKYMKVNNKKLITPLKSAALLLVSTIVLNKFANVKGIRETIPAKMMIEIPLPIPKLEIRSPIHNKNIVPAVKTTET